MYLEHSPRFGPRTDAFGRVGVRVLIGPVGLTLGVLVGLLAPTSLVHADGDYTSAGSSLTSGGVRDIVAGAYTLSGAIGQPNANEVLAAGEYLLHPGFWVLDEPATSDLPVPGAALPVSFALAQPFPNPFSGGATFAVEIPDSRVLTLDIFSVDGRHLRRLIARQVDPGQVRVHWDGRDDDGQEVGDGVFFARARLGTEERTARIVRFVP